VSAGADCCQPSSGVPGSRTPLCRYPWPTLRMQHAAWTSRRVAPPVPTLGRTPGHPCRPLRTSLPPRANASSRCSGRRAQWNTSSLRTSTSPCPPHLHHHRAALHLQQQLWHLGCCQQVLPVPLRRERRRRSNGPSLPSVDAAATPALRQPARLLPVPTWMQLLPVVTEYQQHWPPPLRCSQPPGQRGRLHPPPFLLHKPAQQRSCQLQLCSRAMSQLASLQPQRLPAVHLS
jgi:hypothetical protein